MWFFILIILLIIIAVYKFLDEQGFLNNLEIGDLKNKSGEENLRKYESSIIESDNSIKKQINYVDKNKEEFKINNQFDFEKELNDFDFDDFENDIENSKVNEMYNEIDNFDFENDEIIDDDIYEVNEFYFDDDLDFDYNEIDSKILDEDKMLDCDNEEIEKILSDDDNDLFIEMDNKYKLE